MIMRTHDDIKFLVGHFVDRAVEAEACEIINLQMRIFEPCFDLHCSQGS